MKVPYHFHEYPPFVSLQNVVFHSFGHGKAPTLEQAFVKVSGISVSSYGPVL